MKKIDLNFVTRVKLIGVVGTAPAGDGGIEKLHALLRVFEKVDFTAAERAFLTITTLDSGATNYKINGFEEPLGYSPAAGERFAEIAVELEDAEARWMLQQVKEWSRNATIADLKWLDPLVSALEKAEPPREPKMQFKRRNK